MKHTLRSYLTTAVLLTGLFTIAGAAQIPSATYVVHLAHQTQWGPATLAPGTYRVSSQSPYPTLTLTGRGITLANGAHPDVVFLTPSAIRGLRAESVSASVVLNEKGNNVRVASMKLGDPAMELRFDAPAAPSPAPGSVVAGRP